MATATYMAALVPKNTMMHRPSQTEFIAAVRALRAPHDNAVEHTPYLGGGIRFSGFCAVSGRQFCNALRAHGKKATFRLTGQLFVDCYDNIDPPTPTLKNVASITPAPARKSADYTRGAIVYSPYTCDTVSSADIEAVLLDQTVLDVVMRCSTLEVAAVSPASTNVVDGLRMQIQNNPRFRNNKTVFKPTVSFKAGGPPRRARSKRSLLVRAAQHLGLLATSA